MGFSLLPKKHEHEGNHPHYGRVGENGIVVAVVGAVIRNFIQEPIAQKAKGKIRNQKAEKEKHDLLLLGYRHISITNK